MRRIGIGLLGVMAAFVVAFMPHGEIHRPMVQPAVATTPTGAPAGNGNCYYYVVYKGSQKGQAYTSPAPYSNKIVLNCGSIFLGPTPTPSPSPTPSPTPTPTPTATPT